MTRNGPRHAPATVTSSPGSPVQPTFVYSDFSLPREALAETFTQGSLAGKPNTAVRPVDHIVNLQITHS